MATAIIIRTIDYGHYYFLPSSPRKTGDYTLLISVTAQLIGGLAEDICVASIALDGRKEDFQVVLLTDATRPTSFDRCERAHSTMEIAGVEFESSRD